MTVAPTARDAVNHADVAIAMLTDDDASRSVWLDPEAGALAVVPDGCIVIEASTVTPGHARRMAAAAANRGLALLEAPVVGSRPQADAGALVALIGGDVETLERATPVIDTFAATVWHAGAIGDAATMKLAINGLFAAQVAAFGEVAGLIERSAIDTDSALDLLAGLPITAPGLQRVLGLMRGRQFDPNFPVPLVAKDLGYLDIAAEAVGADLPMMRRARAVFDAGADGAQAALDIAGIADRYLAEPER